MMKLNLTAPPTTEALKNAAAAIGHIDRVDRMRGTQGTQRRQNTAALETQKCQTRSRAVTAYSGRQHIEYAVSGAGFREHFTEHNSVLENPDSAPGDDGPNAVGFVWLRWHPLLLCHSSCAHPAVPSGFESPDAAMVQKSLQIGTQIGK